MTFTEVSVCPFCGTDVEPEGYSSCCGEVGHYETMLECGVCREYIEKEEKETHQCQEANH